MLEVALWAVVGLCGLLLAAAVSLAQRLSAATAAERGWREEAERWQAEARQASEALAATRKELDALTYAVSHDLRAPLRSVDGFTTALLEDYGERLGLAGKDYAQRAQRGARRAMEMIDGLLTLSRAARVELRPEWVDLSSLARAIAAQLQARAPERAVSFTIADGLEAWADPELLRLALRHLLDNAWKFTSKHPAAHIEVGAEGSGSQQVYYVRDDGAGFQREYAEGLFVPFRRLHRAEEFEGNGIGLAIVQRVVQRHGGRVWAEGEVEQGATFRFTLGP